MLVTVCTIKPFWLRGRSQVFITPLVLEAWYCTSCFHHDLSLHELDIDWFSDRYKSKSACWWVACYCLNEPKKKNEKFNFLATVITLLLLHIYLQHQPKNPILRIELNTSNKSPNHVKTVFLLTDNEAQTASSPESL